MSNVSVPVSVSLTCFSFLYVGIRPPEITKAFCACWMMFCWILNHSIFSFKLFYLSVFSYLLSTSHPTPNLWEACDRKELPLCPMNLSLLQTQASSVGKKAEIVVVFHLISMVWKVKDYTYKKYICINVLILTLGKQALGPPMSRKGHSPKGSFLPARPCLFISLPWLASPVAMKSLCLGF